MRVLSKSLTVFLGLVALAAGSKLAQREPRPGTSTYSGNSDLDSGLPTGWGIPSGPSTTLATSFTPSNKESTTGQPIEAYASVSVYYNNRRVNVASKSKALRDVFDQISEEDEPVDDEDDDPSEDDENNEEDEDNEEEEDKDDEDDEASTDSSDSSDSEDDSSESSESDDSDDEDENEDGKDSEEPETPTNAKAARGVAARALAQDESDPVDDEEISSSDSSDSDESSTTNSEDSDSHDDSDSTDDEVENTDAGENEGEEQPTEEEQPIVTPNPLQGRQVKFTSVSERCKYDVFHKDTDLYRASDLPYPFLAPGPMLPTGSQLSLFQHLSTTDATVTAECYTTLHNMSTETEGLIESITAYDTSSYSHSTWYVLPSSSSPSSSSSTSPESSSKKRLVTRSKRTPHATPAPAIAQVTPSSTIGGSSGFSTAISGSSSASDATSVWGFDAVSVPSTVSSAFSSFSSVYTPGASINGSTSTFIGWDAFALVPSSASDGQALEQNAESTEEPVEVSEAAVADTDTDTDDKVEIIEPAEANDTATTAEPSKSVPETTIDSTTTTTVKMASSEVSKVKSLLSSITASSASSVSEELVTTTTEEESGAPTATKSLAQPDVEVQGAADRAIYEIAYSAVFGLGLVVPMIFFF